VYLIHAENVDEAYREAMYQMQFIGVTKPSRNGQVMSAPTPVITIYEKPEQRMLFNIHRDANPFFHIFEGIWMLTGRNDVEWLKQFNSRMVDFSDDGRTFHGAYGHRWREHFAVDQLEFVINELEKNPTTRRAVMAMWDPSADITQMRHGGKDVPCNTTIFFTIRNNGLEMTVCNRSNDIVWGCYGANAVHMSMLHEFVARAINLPVARYYQISNDWHIYEPHWHLMGVLPGERMPYPTPHVPITHRDVWQDDVDVCFPTWVEQPYRYNGSIFVRTVLQPMRRAWDFYKENNQPMALKEAEAIKDGAVRQACTEWLLRRKWKADNTPIVEAA
jgi:thymidylate synthase